MPSSQHSASQHSASQHPVFQRLVNGLKNSLSHIKGQPEPAAFNSSAPFCVDTMSLEHWLKYVFVPRIQAVLDAGAPLPENSNLSAQVELLFSAEKKAQVLQLTQAIDAYLTSRQLPAASFLKSLK